MFGENPPNTSEQSSQKIETISVSFESLSALEVMSAKELLVQKQQLEAKIWKFRELDKQNTLAKGSNIYAQSSESDFTLQAQKKIDMIHEVIAKKIRTLQDTAKDSNIAYTPADVVELYTILMPDAKANYQQAQLGLKDRIASLIENTPRADGKNMPILSVDELMNISGLISLKNHPKYNVYKKIITLSLIDQIRDTTEFSGKNERSMILERETVRLGLEQLSILEQIRLTWDQSDIASTVITTDRILDVIGTSKDYNEARLKLEWEQFWLKISEQQYDSLAKNARSSIEYTNQESQKLEENKQKQILALKDGNIVQAFQQEIAYQKETSQIAYYRDLRSSLAKNEPNSLNQISSQSNESINVGSADFSKNLMEFMNDPTLNSIYPKLSDGTALPIIKSWPDSCVVQGCEVRTENVASLIDINQTLANEWLRFFSTKTPLTKILANMEQALRAKGVQNVPNFGDPQTFANYGDNIVDILYQVIDPNPKEQIANVSERINTARKRFAGYIPLIAYGRQSWVVREDSGIDLNAFTNKLNTIVQSGYPFRFWSKW